MSQFTLTTKQISHTLVKVFFSLCLIAVSATPALASSWSVSSTIVCNHSMSDVSGDSDLYWDGQSIFANGTSSGWLWWWYNGAWYQIDSDSQSASGSRNVAGASTYAGYTNGPWQETGGATSNFFSGQQNSYSPPCN